MIYLQHITDPQVIALANTWRRANTGKAFTLVLYSGADRKEVARIECENLDKTWRTGIEISVTLPAGLAVGEYRYALIQDGVEWGTGLARVGDYHKPVTGNGSAGVTFQQYEG